MEITFSICGSAGRGTDASKMSKKHFDAACIVASSFIDQFAESNYIITHLVSGGSAFIDHVAVNLFLDKKVSHLRLYLPCPFKAGAFENEFNINKIPNPGGHSSAFDTAGTINNYHYKFQRTTGINSLTQIQTAQYEGAELLLCKGGFYGRNAMVAKSDLILACTFGKGHMLKEGGTANTIRCYLKRIHKEGIFDKSFHYDLNSGEIFVGCQVPKEEEKIPKRLSSIIGSGPWTFTPDVFPTV